MFLEISKIKKHFGYIFQMYNLVLPADYQKHGKGK